MCLGLELHTFSNRTFQVLTHYFGHDAGQVAKTCCFSHTFIQFHNNRRVKASEAKTDHKAFRLMFTGRGMEEK